MTAILAVRKADRVELFSDTAAIDVGGVVIGFAAKQFLRPPNTVIAFTGTVQTALEFVRRANLQGFDAFDGLIDCAETLWRESLQFANDPRAGLQAIVMAGRSDRRGQLELYSIDSIENRLEDGGDIFASGPCEDSGPILTAFSDKYKSDPEQIRPQAAITLFEDLRRSPRQFLHGTAPAVGGSIDHTIISHDGASTAVLHRWPDVVGERIK